MSCASAHFSQPSSYLQRQLLLLVIEYLYDAISEAITTSPVRQNHKV